MPAPPVAPPDSKEPDSAEQRTAMANFRTQLALDRTMLAWIRTNLAMASFGFGIVGFFRSLPPDTSKALRHAQLHQGAIAFGVGLIVLGLSAMLLSAVSHWQTLRRLRSGQLPALTQWPLSITVGVLLVVLGIAAMWSLLASRI